MADAAAPGVVHLVGAGPGDPDLLTIKALRVLEAADIIFHDDLVTEDILALARPAAERVFVGKRSGRPGIGQAAINRRLVEAARRGLNTVRLKGGDPFVFGRGGEEMEYLREAGIKVSVVPGVSAAFGCAAEAGIPLSHRGEANRIALVTAHRATDAAAVDWNGFGAADMTVVVYMGRDSAAAVAAGLIAAGRAPETPAAVLARGTRADSAAAVGRLDRLAALVAEAGEGPALLVIGEVVKHSKPWRESLTALAAARLAG
ncbi:uroporphyrinogen-III C-methyltransferase [Agaricicola taiwanensis]|uniref:uroporphyrinogen-III C-methyltransferase n=1 Tax=Agaricicola taiwanensis TaxID=591372 RepID=UPI001E55A800|nr:uroporphyrinogen-III C-methyltransferase [Agaricicola taiwanensis]